MKDLIINKFNNIIRVSDPKGNCLTFKSRHSSCFIITYKGKIRFTFQDRTLIADPSHAVFIPKGADYKNECLEAAESIVINLGTVNKHEPCLLRPVDEKTALNTFDTVNRLSAEATEENKCRIFGELYLLAYKMLHKENKKSAKQSLAEKAMMYFQNNYRNADLKIGDAAKDCNISTVYLRRVFCEVFGKTPFDALTDIRMSNAHMLVLENRPVTEIALAVGYSDIYQFSRAYKRYFGHAPSHSVDQSVLDSDGV